MKKRLMLTLIALTVAVAMSACGESEDRGSRRDRNREEEREGALEEEPEEEEATPEPMTPVAGGMLGTDIGIDYDGFTYLYGETLMTESAENQETGKMESQSLVVFIPKGDYTSVNRDRAYVDYLGVSFSIELSPYIRYDQEDYLLKENMEYYLEEEFDPFYYPEYRAVEVSDAKEQGNGMTATAQYCRYDSWDDEYIPVLSTYYLTELPNDLTVLVEIKINYNEVTGKTDELLKELETFYGFEIDWSKEAAEKKLEAFLNSGEADFNIFSTYYLLFELPAGWAQDYSWDYSVDAFAPGGDAEFAECAITFEQEYLGMDAPDMDQILRSESDIEDYRAYFEEQMGDTVSVTLENYGDTVLGTAMKITYSMEEDGYAVRVEAYVMSQDGYLYTAQAMQSSDSTEDSFAILENILATAQVR